MRVHMPFYRQALGPGSTLLVALALASCLQGQTLKTSRIIISQFEDGQAVESGSSFQAGESVFFSFQTENHKVGPNGKIQLNAHVDAFDPRGVPIAPRDEVVIGTSLAEEDKDWKPRFRSQLQIPPIAPTGVYKVKFEVTDQQSRQTATGEATFSVSGARVEPAASLTFRNFGFYRTQDDQAALRNAAYTAGDMLWVRFDLTGYKYGEQNAIDVFYDVAVLVGGERQLFFQENAAGEKSQAFYPQPWVPAEFNLSLQPTMTRGPYTLVLTAHDQVGHQTAEMRAEFRVQ